MASSDVPDKTDPTGRSLTEPSTDESDVREKHQESLHDDLKDPRRPKHQEQQAQQKHQKPLPSLPTQHTSLSTESRLHRARFIRHVLSDLSTAAGASGTTVNAGTTLDRRAADDWARAIEDALDDVSAAMGREDWLRGFRRKREAMRGRRFGRGGCFGFSKDGKDGKEGKEGKEAGSSTTTTDGSESKDEHEKKDADSILTQIRKHAASDPNPAASPDSHSAHINHLVLCVAPFGAQHLSSDFGGGVSGSPHVISCAYLPAAFSFSERQVVDDDGSLKTTTTLLFGLDDWESSLSVSKSESIPLKIVGGTFVLTGCTSPAQHFSLTTVLRASIYVHLALILDQHLLSDSGIKLDFPKPQPPPPPPPSSEPNSPLVQSPEDGDGKQSHRPSFSSSSIRSSLFHFLSKRAFGQRSSTITEPSSSALSSSSLSSPSSSASGGLSRNRTIQVPRKEGVVDEDLAQQQQQSRSSLDSIGRRIRKFSLRDPLHSYSPGSKAKKVQQQLQDDPNKPYSSALARIEAGLQFLSTSFDVKFGPPEVLVRLARLEEGDGREGRGKRANWKSREKCALGTVLGWDEKNLGRGMTGLVGFARQQTLEVLVSRRVRPGGLEDKEQGQKENDGKDGKDGKDIGEPKDKDTAKSAKDTIRYACGRPRWMTLLYYSKQRGGSKRDPTLGELVHDLTAAASLPCEEPGCHFKCGEHQLRFVHDGVRVEVTFGEGEKDDAIKMWESCAVCGSKSKIRDMSDGSYLLSFAKYLELLIYSNIIHASDICEHTRKTTSASPTTPNSNTPTFKFNILRHFSTDGRTLTFTFSEASDIFELHVPRLQMCRSVADKSSSHPMCPEGQNHDITLFEDERTKLRREVKAFWEGISDYLDKIEDALSGPEAEAIKKTLPRLPSVTDEAYEEIFSHQATQPSSSTISTYLTMDTTDSSLSGGSTTMDPVVVRVTRENQPSHAANASGGSTTNSVETAQDALVLLVSMRYSFQRTEQLLYAQLARTPAMLLNDVRRSLLASGRGAQKRITAWKKKHCGLLNLNLDSVGELSVPEPDWWDKKCHPLPGGSVVVQEGDLGSIIAFALSSSEFQQELANASLHRSTSGTNLSGNTSEPASILPFQPSQASQPSTPSANSAVSTKGYKFFPNSAPPPPQLDPDQEGIVWHESESCAAAVTRKENARDSASILSIRDMLRSRTPVDPGATLNSLPASLSKAIPSAPPSARSKPADLQLSKAEAGGQVFTATLPKEMVESVENILRNPELISSASAESLRQQVLRSSPEALSLSSSISSSRREKDQAKERIQMQGDKGDLPVSTSSSAASSVSDVTVSHPRPPPEVPPKDYPSSKAGTPPPGQTSNGKAKVAPSLFGNTLTTGLSYALRLVSSGASTPRGGGNAPVLPPKVHHGLLLMDGNAIEERPHIKYEVVVGKRLKLACTVYYARQFDLLRKRCGVDDIFVQSLSKSTNWAAEGGKSRANFWKTCDDRFIIKTLVNAWNVADLHVLLELGPAYFKYMESTVSKPTVLVKILGVYTVEVKNFESGSTSKLDLVVMENLFYNRKVDKAFDLKGIQGRKVKPSTNDTNDARRKQTLFDGEWIEGQQKTLMLVRPESKKILREAVRSDADFLAKMNIMDYSLLLGIDVERKQLTCGLVDTIGSYTFAKTLEYKAKHGLHSGKEITVIPPAEYEERFVNALDGYFVACPDKWSKPLDDKKIPNNIDLLPGIL